MSSWLSAIPVQNCSLNLKLSILKKRAKSRLPQQSKPTPAPTIPTPRIARPLLPSGIVGIRHEVVQGESHSPYEMTRYVRLFNNTLFSCKGPTYRDVAVSGGALCGRERVRFFFPPPEFSSAAGELNGSGLFDFDRRALDGGMSWQACWDQSALPGTT